MPVGNSITMGQDFDLAAPFNLNDPSQIDAWKAVWVGYRKEFVERATAAGYSVEMVGSQTNGCGIFSACHHEGHGAWSSQLIEVAIEGWINAQHPDVILLHTGTVDALNGPLRADATMRIVALLERIRAVAPNVAIVMVTVPPIADNLTGPESNVSVNQINVALPGIVIAQQRRGQRIILVRADLTLADLSDGIHPNRSGYHKTEEALYAGFVAILNPCTQPTPRIAQTVTVAGPGMLRVTLSPKDAGNAISTVSFGARTNVQPVTDLALVNGTATFTVHRTGPGASQLAFTATDACGSWPSFVGGGPNAY